MKKIIVVFLFFVVLFLFFISIFCCDNYNKDVPGFLDDALAVVRVKSCYVADESLLKNNNIIIPGLIKPDSIILIELNNSKKKEVEIVFEYFESGEWKSFDNITEEDNKTTEYINSALFESALIKHIPGSSKIEIEINGGKIGKEYKLRIKLIDKKTLYDFGWYDLPVFKCSDYMGDISILAAILVENKIMLLLREYLRGDEADACYMEISCAAFEIKEVYERGFTEVGWGSWYPEGITESGTEMVRDYILGIDFIIKDGIDVLPDINFLFKNAMGVIYKTTKTLTNL